MQIDKQSRDILDLLRESEPDEDRGTFTYEAISELSSLDETDVIRIAKALVGFQLAEFTLGTISGVDFGIALSQRGKCYEEYLGMERKAKWKERAWGLVVGVALTGLAWALSAYVG